jgi:hypothetical protein
LIELPPPRTLATISEGERVADRRRRLGEELSVERTLGGAAEEVVPRPRYEGIVVVVWAAFEHQHLQGWLRGGEAAREGAAGGAAWVEGLLGFLTGEVLIRSKGREGRRRTPDDDDIWGVVFGEVGDYWHCRQGLGSRPGWRGN